MRALRFGERRVACRKGTPTPATPRSGTSVTVWQAHVTAYHNKCNGSPSSIAHASVSIAALRQVRSSPSAHSSTTARPLGTPRMYTLGLTLLDLWSGSWAHMDHQYGGNISRLLSLRPAHPKLPSLPGMRARRRSAVRGCTRLMILSNWSLRYKKKGQGER